MISPEAIESMIIWVKDSVAHSIARVKVPKYVRATVKLKPEARRCTYLLL